METASIVILIQCEVKIQYNWRKTREYSGGRRREKTQLKEREQISSHSSIPLLTYSHALCKRIVSKVCARLTCPS